MFARYQAQTQLSGQSNNGDLADKELRQNSSIIRKLIKASSKVDEPNVEKIRRVQLKQYRVTISVGKGSPQVILSVNRFIKKNN